MLKCLQGTPTPTPTHLHTHPLHPFLEVQQERGLSSSMTPPRSSRDKARPAEGTTGVRFRDGF